LLTPLQASPYLVSTDDKEGAEEDDGLSTDEDDEDDEEPAAADAQQEPPNPEHLVEFHAKTTSEGPSAATGATRTAIHTAVKRQADDMQLRQAAQAVLDLRRSADPYEIKERTLALIRFVSVAADSSLMMALASLDAVQVQRIHEIGRKRMAAIKALENKKRMLANALARVAKLEALETDLTEKQKTSLALGKKKVETYRDELLGK